MGTFIGMSRANSPINLQVGKTGEWTASPKSGQTEVMPVLAASEYIFAKMTFIRDNAYWQLEYLSNFLFVKYTCRFLFHAADSNIAHTYDLY